MILISGTVDIDPERRDEARDAYRDLLLQHPDEDTRTDLLHRLGAVLEQSEDWAGLREVLDAQLELLGGPRDGEVIFRHDGFGENFGLAIDPPLDVAATGARGLRFTCGYDNPRDDVVRWGSGDQEMCVLALQADTNMGFDGSVLDRADPVTVEGEVKHNGPCTALGIPWDHEKPGGEH